MRLEFMLDDYSDSGNNGDSHRASHDQNRHNGYGCGTHGFGITGFGDYLHQRDKGRVDTVHPHESVLIVEAMI